MREEPLTGGLSCRHFIKILNNILKYKEKNTIIQKSKITKYIINIVCIVREATVRGAEGRGYSEGRSTVRGEDSEKEATERAGHSKRGATLRGEYSGGGFSVGRSRIEGRPLFSYNNIY